ncbi:MAG: wax synthase family protein [Planctomycetia bacterium]
MIGVWLSVVLGRGGWAMTGGGRRFSLGGTARVETATPATDASRASLNPGVTWRHGWGPLVLGPWLVPLLAPRDWPRWAVMWSLAFVIFCGCKWLTWRRTPVRGATLRRHLGYFAAWPGLDARCFLKPDRSAAPPTRAEWSAAAGKSALGLGILFGLARLVPADRPYLVGWVGMVGIILVLHFGAFHLLSCAWRAAGVEAKPLMNRPLAATSLSDFWGRRWNTAFRDLTHRFLFRPLTPRLGPGGAVFAGFAFSGLVHDLVISWPAGGGYGGPTAFFLLQGVGILAERSRAGKAMGLGDGGRGRLFTIIVLLGPVGLLFHRPFVVEVVVPFLRAVGAV